MFKKNLTHPIIIWSVCNFLIGSYIWTQINAGQEIDIRFIDINLGNFIITFVIINSTLAIASLKFKEFIFGYLFNSITTYLLILILLQLFLITN